MQFLKKVNWVKVAIVAGFIVLLVAVLVGVKLQYDAKLRQEALEKQVVEMKQLQDGIARSQSQYVSKEDLEKFAEQNNINLSVIRDDLAKYDAQIKGISRILASSRGYQGNNIPSHGTNPRPDGDPGPTGECSDGNCDPYGYLTAEQVLEIMERFPNGDIPFGSVGFSAWKDKPWSVDIKGRTYKVSTVLSHDEDGKTYVHNKFQIEVDGHSYDVEIEDADFVETYPEASFKFDPHLNIGISPAVSINTSSNLLADEPRARAEFIPSLEVSFFSYGKTTENPDFKFLGIGLGYASQANTLGITLSPVDYNLGSQIPLIRNFYIGPTLGVDINGSVLVGAGIKVGL